MNKNAYNRELVSRKSFSSIENALWLQKHRLYEESLLMCGNLISKTKTKRGKIELYWIMSKNCDWLKEYKQSEKFFESAVGMAKEYCDLDSSSPNSRTYNIYANIAEKLSSLGRYSDALEIINKEIKKESSWQRCWLVKGQIYENMGQKPTL